MDWITETVAIGNSLEARDAAALAAGGFRAAVSLDGSLTPADAAAFDLDEVVMHRLIDGPGNQPRVFANAVADPCRLAAACPPVLVQCHAGRSRSAAVVAGYLMRCRGIGADDAIVAVAARREVNVTAALVRLLRQL